MPEEFRAQIGTGPGSDRRILPSGVRRGYVRFAALGDSATCGLGDADVTGNWRGWARILSDAIGQDHDVSFCNVAVSGSTVARVRRQLPVALAHRPHIASLIVGLNDTMRSTWNSDAVRADLLHCAGSLTEAGALLLTVRFHDHTRVLHLPPALARPMRARIDALNDVYDEIHYLYGGLQLDLAAHPDINDRRFWSIDRLHPSELGHRTLAREFAALLHDARPPVRSTCARPRRGFHRPPAPTSMAGGRRRTMAHASVAGSGPQCCAVLDPISAPERARRSPRRPPGRLALRSLARCRYERRAPTSRAVARRGRV